MKKKSKKASPALRQKAFQRTMTQARTHMNIWQRSFSVIAHSRPLEVIGDLLAATVARPIPLIGGLVGMIAMLSLFYGVAKSVGYHLSGFEGPAGFVIGWVVGAIIEFSRLITGGKR